MIQNFNVLKNSVVVHYTNGTTKEIYRNQYSGNLYYRYKIDAWIDPTTPHPCIYLGVDKYGVQYVIHNHYEDFGSAFIDTLGGFAKGQQFFADERACANAPLDRIVNALRQVITGEKYKVFSYNCQTTVNLACNNKRTSESVDKWLFTGVAVFFGAVLLNSAFSRK